MRDRLQLVLATEEHARSLVLRPEDIHELLAIDPHREPQEAVVDSWAISHSRIAAVTDQGEVIAVGGLALTEEDACPWLLCSSKVGRYGREALARCRGLLRAWQCIAGPSRVLNNFVHRDNLPAQRFITALGFRIVPPPAGDWWFFYLPPRSS